MHNFKELKVWQKSIELVIEIYEFTKNIPNEERFGIVSQLQRAVISISCNISEGAGKSSNKDFKRFLDIALGSTNEVENLIIICNRLSYIEEESSSLVINNIQEIRKMIIGLKKSL